MAKPQKAPSKEELLSENDPLWFKDAIIYELHVRAFYDSNGDGIGDFQGLIEKLDYLQDLGVTAVWLLPFYPSPLRDDGYDIADYRAIHPSYGNMADFRTFMREAHRRGIRVITELVINHTSDQNPWFQKARRARPGSRWRNFYVWSDTPEKYKETRIIFKDFEASNWSWDPVANAYYWHRFYSHQPDLNFENPEVVKAVKNVLDYWIDMGVDGMRLDAIPYLFEREGTNCENLPETHEMLKELRAHVDKRQGHQMFLAEANQWPEDAAAYFGEGDECHMNFHFPLMPRMFMALRMEDRAPIVDILEQTPDIPDNCQWAMFLRNHDELTLEMVTDEERDYMYRAFAEDPTARINLGIRRRLAPLLKNDRRSIELMNALLFSLGGTPVIYYGDEIGMGDNIFLGDRNGVRTPMQWSADRNAGFSKANAQKLYLPTIIDPEYHFQTVNVEAQQHNPNSILWWMKRVIALRKQYKAFGRGTIRFLAPENRKVLVYLREYEDETILCIANLSRYAQSAELDLSEFKGRIPVEMFGQTEFPAIGDLYYFLTLGARGFYWFELCPQKAEVRPIDPSNRSALPQISVSGKWENVFEGRARKQLEEQLPAFLMRSRWFGGKGRRMKDARITEVIPVRHKTGTSCLTMIGVEYREGEPETYMLPLDFLPDKHAPGFGDLPVTAVFVRLKTEGGEGSLHDAVWNRDFCRALLDLFGGRKRLKGTEGEVSAATTKAFRRLKRQAGEKLEPHVLGVEQSNTSIVYGRTFLLKLFRKVDRGVNPDLEIGTYLTEKTKFGNAPAVAGSLEYDTGGKSGSYSLSILQAYVENSGDAWRYTLDSVNHYYDAVEAHGDQPLPEFNAPSLLELSRTPIPDALLDSIGPYHSLVPKLGLRTAELHLALSGEDEDPQFIPEDFSTLYQRSLFQQMQQQVKETFGELRKKGRDLDEATREYVKELLSRETELHARLKAVVAHKFEAQRMRHHGDYHLGQILYTGNDFVIIDFEGEPARSLSERRLKRSPLRDVAGMIRSFHYAAHAALYQRLDQGMRPEELRELEPWAELWYRANVATFLESYLQRAADAPFIPENPEDLETLLDAFLIEKGTYEIRYELNNRPAWLRIPLQGVLGLLRESE